MPKVTGSQPDSEKLRQVAGFLRQADQLVREQKYDQALEQIASARAKDPHNSYAEAYEERVKLLATAIQSSASALAGGADLGVPSAFTKHLENIANLALLSAQRISPDSSASISPHHQTVPQTERKKIAEGPGKEASQSSPDFYLERAEALLRRGDVAGASEETERMCRLSPVLARLHQLDRELLHAQSSAGAAETSSSDACPHHDGQLALLADEPHLIRERSPQQNGGRGVSRPKTNVPPGDRTDSPSWAEQQTAEGVRNPQAGLDAGPFLRQDKQPNEELMRPHIERHLRDALWLSSRGDFTAALKVVSEALAMSPFNATLEACENAILARLDEQMDGRDRSGSNAVDKKNERAHTSTTEEEHKARIIQHLNNAQASLDGDRFSDALAEVSRAVSLIDLNDNSVHAGGAGILRRETDLAHDLEFQADSRTSQSANDSSNDGTSLDVPLPRTSQDSTISGHDSLELSMTKRLCRIMNFLVDARFHEALAEAEQAAAHDGANSDLRSLRDKIAASVSRGGEELRLSNLHEVYEALLNDVRRLVLHYSYENIVEGIDRVLAVFPASAGLLRVKGKAMSSAEGSKGWHANTSRAGTPKRIQTRTTPERELKGRTKRDSQMGLDFDKDLNGDAVPVYSIQPGNIE